ncbi:hypothetical protein NDU88_002950 [Pleurodeles waltl]|uniref:Uncharacterized protein n=1 Tax=Pleurodeles waltl TaxID=8319 RepID=A0AAV7UER5_PLEWA|nr:hypothetical protein NDU88_002950 [Pleurodeles waltl]
MKTYNGDERDCYSASHLNNTEHVEKKKKKGRNRDRIHDLVLCRKKSAQGRVARRNPTSTEEAPCGRHQRYASRTPP